MITRYKLLKRIEVLDYDLMEIDKRVGKLEKGLKELKAPVKKSTSKATKAKD